MAISDTVIIYGEWDGMMDIPQVDDILWTEGPVDPYFTVTAVVNEGGGEFTLTTTQGSAGALPVTDDTLEEDGGNYLFYLLADAYVETEEEEEIGPYTPFPPDRPDAYDPDLTWDEESGAWGIDYIDPTANRAEYLVILGEQGEVYYRGA